MIASPKLALEGKPKGNTAPATERKPTTIAEVLERWAQQGPIIHEPTGIAALDGVLGGGPTYGSRGIIQGAPDAGKTALLAQVCATYAGRGVIAGFHGIDEEDDDLVTREMQRAGWRRDECESRAELAAMRDRIQEGTIYYYDGTWTIEDAAADLHKRANGKRAAYFVDSIQTVKCNRTLIVDRETSARAEVTANMLALRAVATRHRIIAIGSSEMNRGSYRSNDPSEQSDDMAAGAESRAIEYQSRYLVTLRNVKGESELVQAKVTKNKLGPKAEFFLRIDRARQTLSAANAPEQDEGAPGRGRDRKLDETAERVFQVILAHPGIGTRQLRARTGMGVEALDRAMVRLEDADRIDNRPTMHGKRTDPHYYAITPSTQVEAAQ